MKKWKSKAKWQSQTTKNKEEEIYKEIEKVNPMWVEEENIQTLTRIKEAAWKNQ